MTQGGQQKMYPLPHDTISFIGVAPVELQLSSRDSQSLSQDALELLWQRLVARHPLKAVNVGFSF